MICILTIGIVIVVSLFADVHIDFSWCYVYAVETRLVGVVFVFIFESCGEIDPPHFNSDVV